MARKSVLWNIWTPATNPRFEGEVLNVGRVNAWADTDPAAVVELWIAGRVRLSPRATYDPAKYTARHYPPNVLDDYGVGRGG